MKLLKLLAALLFCIVLTFTDATPKPNKNNQRKSQRASSNSKNLNAQQQKLLLEVRAKAIQELTQQIKSLTDELSKNIDYFEHLAYIARRESSNQIMAIKQYFTNIGGNGTQASSGCIRAIAAAENELKLYLEMRPAYNAEIRLQKQLKLIELNQLLKKV